MVKDTLTSIAVMRGRCPVCQAQLIVWKKKLLVSGTLELYDFCKYNHFARVRDVDFPHLTDYWNRQAEAMITLGLKTAMLNDPYWSMK
jgi:hypothetical protein